MSQRVSIIVIEMKYLQIVTHSQNHLNRMCVCVCVRTAHSCYPIDIYIRENVIKCEYVKI